MKKLTIKDLENFFGARDIYFNVKFVKKYGNDDKNIYWIPNNEFDNTFFASEHPGNKQETVMWVSRMDMCPEIQDEVALDKSPFKFLKD